MKRKLPAISFHFSRKSPEKLCFFVMTFFFLLILPMAVNASVPSDDQKPSPLCKLLSQKNTYKSFTKKKIKEVQDALYVTGYDTYGVDGIIGSNTRDAMRRFCIDFTIETPKDLASDYADILIHYAAIARLYPDWKEIILDPGFGEWIEKQPVKRRSEIYRTRRSGTPGQIIALFKRYKQDVKYGDAPLPTASIEDPDDYIISFNLTAADMDELRALLVYEAIAEQVSKMQDEPFENKTEFKNALEDKIKEATDKKGLTETFRDHVLKLSEETSSARLTEDSFSNLKAEGMPENIIETLTDLKDVPYPDIMELRKAVEAKFERVSGKDRTLILDRVRQLTDADHLPSFMLSGQFFKLMKLSAVPDFLLDALKVLDGLEFSDKAELEAQVTGILDSMTGQFDDYDDYLKLIDSSTEELTEFKLTKEGLEKLRTDFEAQYEGSASVLGKIKTLYYKAKFLFSNRVENIMEQLIKFQDESYINKTRLLNALELRVDDLSDEEKLLIVKEAEQASFYTLGEKTSNTLKVDELPDTIMEQIQPLMGLRYPEKDSLDKAVESKIRKVSDEEKSLILDYVKGLQATEKPAAYKLTEQFFKEMELKNIPPQLTDLLTVLKEVEFVDKEELENEVLKALKEAKQYYATFLKYRPAILKYSEESESYQVTVQAVTTLENELKEKIVPKTVLDMLTDLQDVEYMGKALFDNVLKTKIEGLTIRYESIVSKEIERLDSSKLTEEFFTKLSDGGVPDEIVLSVVGLSDSDFPDKDSLEEAAKKAIDNVLGSYEGYSPLIIMQARKRHRYKDFKAEPLLWNGEECGCSRGNLSGVVYGFYPFWMSGKEQKLDFSNLTRIGYFAIPFDKEGNLWAKMHWEKEKSGFVNTARKYKAKVDLVIYNNNWKMWKGFDDRKREKLANNIVSAVSASADNSLLNRLKPYISMGSSSVPSMGDGVTLYFDFADTSKEEKKELSSSIMGFIELLRKKLKAVDEDYFLNVMLPMREIEGEIYSLDNLKELVPAIEHGKKGYEERDIVDLLLVLLEEPSSPKKKRLRMQIEKDFKGVQRKNILRKLIPVISPTAYKGEQVAQLEDDLIYFEDNFRGVGLWPLPAIEITGGEEGGGEEAGDGGAPVESDIKSLIVEGFHSEEDLDLLKAALLNYAPSVCKFVCPNSWYFVALFDILLALSILYAILSFWHCELRLLAKKYMFLLAGVAILVLVTFYSVVICDPSWAELGDELLIIMFLVGVFGAIWGFIRKMKQADMP